MFLFVVMAESEKTLCGFCHQGKEREIDCGTLHIHLEKDGKTAAHKMCMVCSIMRFLPSASKLRQGNIFRSVCQEFCPHGGGCLPQCMLGYTPLGRHPPPQQTATAADGKHPTGMHSCFTVCSGEKNLKYVTGSQCILKCIA